MSKRLFWTLQLSGWFGFGVAMALSRLGRYPLDYMVATKGVLALSGLVVSLLMRWCYRRWLTDTASIAKTVAVTVAVSFLMAQVWTAFYNLADARIATALLNRPVTINNATQLFSASLYHAFALLAWSVFYVGIKRQQALQTERERSLRAESLAHQARLQALRFQIQPHFLFNTLNALSTLIVEQRTTEASRMLARISDFLRHTLAAPDTEEVTLEEEIEFTRLYLEIEQVRFGDKLQVAMDVAPDARLARVPSLILQPLVENAVRHAIAHRTRPGTLRVAAARDNGRLRLRVTDAGPDKPVEQATRPTAGVGLSNTRARLEQLYGASHQMQSGPTHGGGFEVSIELPFRDVPA